MGPQRIMPAGQGALSGIYNTVLKRNSTYVLAIFTGAFVGEKMMQGGMDGVWAGANSGKRFEDIKGRFKTDDDDEYVGRRAHKPGHTTRCQQLELTVGAACEFC